MKIKYLFLVSCTIFLAACSGDKPVAESVSAGVELTPLQKTLQKFKTINNFPIIADTALFNKFNTDDSLGTKEIKTLAVNWFTNGQEGSNDYDLHEFYKIDSIKAGGTYNTWIEKLDIGQTKFSNCYAIQKTVLDSNTTLALWAFTNSSYEACPYSVQQTLQFSIIYKGNVSQSYYLGEYSSFGDPPVSSEITATGKLNADGTFIIDWHQVGDEDMDQPFIFLTDIHYEFIIKDGKISQTKIDKKENVKTPRPKEKES